MSFKPGQSGNPNGRPKGQRARIRAIAPELLDGLLERAPREPQVAMFLLSSLPEFQQHGATK